jgi:NADH-quinone oxidoreductase subunit J
MSLRNLVHCVLALTVTFAGLASFYLQLDAQFIGFSQILVYIGAVVILIVFAILLTRGSSEPSGRFSFSASSVVGVGIAVAVFGLLSGIILTSRALTHEIRPPPEVTVEQIGIQLMGNFILPLEVVGLLLTAALIGAVIIAMREREGKST